MSESASLIIGEKTYELPIITGTEGEKAIDISKLRDVSGFITLDSGYKNTGATKSSITYLDGEEGILKYRGYSIEELAEKSTFLEVAYLLIYGNLPNQTQLNAFQSDDKRIDVVKKVISEKWKIPKRSWRSDPRYDFLNG